MMTRHSRSKTLLTMDIRNLFVEVRCRLIKVGCAILGRRMSIPDILLAFLAPLLLFLFLSPPLFLVNLGTEDIDTRLRE